MVQLIDINNLYIDEDGDWALSYELEKPIIHKRKKKYYSNLKPILEEVIEQNVVRKSNYIDDLYQIFINFDIKNLKCELNIFTINLFNLCPVLKKN